MQTSGIEKYLEQEEPKLEINDQSIKYLNEIRKWTTFFTILGFIMIGILVLLSLLFGILMKNIPLGEEGLPYPPYLFTFAYILFALIYLFPILYLNRFSQYTRDSLNTKDTKLLTLAFKNLKSHFKYIGILTIIFISIYILTFIVAGIGGFMSFTN